jgi:hypothetical protein
MFYYKLVDMPSINEILINKAISDSEFREFEKHRIKLEEFYRGEVLFLCLARNYKDYQNAIIRYLSGYIRDSQLDDVLARTIYSDLNRLILNLLALARMFLDHTEYDLKGKYGKTSPEFVDFKNMCSQKYDANFSYRFAYKLRNFVQHCGMPIGSIEISSSRYKKEGSKSHKVEYTNVNLLSNHTLSIFFDRNKLVESFDGWGKNIKQELEGMDKHIEVTQHIRSFVSDLLEIHCSLVDRRVEKVKASSDYLFDLAKPVLEKNERAKPAIAMSPVRSERNWADEKISFRYFPIDIMRYIRERAYKNCTRDQ